MESKTDIKKFIGSIVDRNYSEAKANLQKMVEVKLQTRIKQAIAQKKSSEVR